MILVFDTETTGLPRKPGSPLSQQPYVMQLAASLYDLDRRPVFEFSTLIKLPEGVLPDPRAEEKHGISAHACLSYGVEPRTALALLNFALERATTTIAHNLQFDEKLIGFLAERVGTPCKLVNPFCTMQACTDVVRCPPTPAMVKAGRTGWKAPRLEECWQFLFQEELSGAHDALVDTRGAARVFFELQDRGLLPGKSG